MTKIERKKEKNNMEDEEVRRIWRTKKMEDDEFGGRREWRMKKDELD
jgi:hypothetical protein